jgi:hypothetical protein
MMCHGELAASDTGRSTWRVLCGCFWRNAGWGVQRLVRPSSTRSSMRWRWCRVRARPSAVDDPPIGAACFIRPRSAVIWLLSVRNRGMVHGGFPVPPAAMFVVFFAETADSAGAGRRCHVARPSWRGFRQCPFRTEVFGMYRSGAEVFHSAARYDDTRGQPWPARRWSR